MKFSPRQHVMAVSGVLAGGSIALLFYVFISLLPGLQSLRESIDNRRAGILAFDEQQSNLKALEEQSSTIRELEVNLDEEIWSFRVEDAFYSKLPAIAKAQGVTMDEPTVSDATPTGLPLVRTFTLVMHGDRDRLPIVLRELQQTRPLLGITGVVYAAVDSTLTVTGKTIWQ